MERYIGLDLGTTTVGIAISDVLGIVHGRENFCFERGNFKKAREHIINLLNEEKINKVVVGLPLMPNGEEQTRCESTKRFMNDILKELPTLEVIYEDERFSTIEAKERMIDMNMKKSKSENLIDMFSAIIILERYLRRIENGTK